MTRYAQLTIGIICLALLATAFSGCGTSRGRGGIPGVSAVTNSVSGMTRSVTNTGKRLFSSAKNKGSAVSKDVSKYTTKMPGTRSQVLTEREQRAIANYRSEQAYRNYMKQYNVSEHGLPKNARVYTSK